MKTPLEFSIFLLYLWKTPDKTKLNLWIFHKLVSDPLEIPRPKTKTHGNSTLFFLGYPWNFTSFLINLWNFHMLFLWYPWKFHILDPPVWIFSGIAHRVDSYLSLHLALFLLSVNKYCWPDMLFHRQAGKVIGQINI